MFFESSELFFNHILLAPSQLIVPRCIEHCCAAFDSFARHGIYAPYMPALVKLVIFSRYVFRVFPVCLVSGSSGTSSVTGAFSGSPDYCISLNELREA